MVNSLNATNQTSMPGPEKNEQSAGRRGHEPSASPVREGSRVIIIGGGPGGYEAATIATRLGAQVTLVERQGLGGAAVLTDVVPSKTLIATAEWLTQTEQAEELGIRVGTDHPVADLGDINARVRRLASAQSRDIRAGLEQQKVRVVDGVGVIDPNISPEGARRVKVANSWEDAQAGKFETTLEAEVLLIATGARPRALPGSEFDGERILNWAQLYDLPEKPEHLIVVGSGVTGAELAGAYQVLGTQVTLVSSRDRVLPNADKDAAELVENVFERRGMIIKGRSRAKAARRSETGVEVELESGEVLKGSHVLIAVGSIPSTKGIGLEEAGVRLTDRGHIEVDRVSRTSAYRIYAAGDCTGVLPLASVAAQQGRIAMWHALGDAVTPLDTALIGSTIFTLPEVATVGMTEEQARESKVDIKAASLPIGRNPRAKMQGISDGFVKIFAEADSGVITGGVVVCERASEQIFPLTLAVTHRMTVDELSSAFTVYPSISGTLSEVARILH
ncbi:MAG: NAD(P)H-quinone dehydrogenase [Actinomycetaceae bacterium]|nr:NAD(P)H-quinone dehydrogenase [Actinomycetaceae bacterium]